MGKRKLIPKGDEKQDNRIPENVLGDSDDDDMALPTDPETLAEIQRLEGEIAQGTILLKKLASERGEDTSAKVVSRYLVERRDDIQALQRFCAAEGFVSASVSTNEKKIS